MQREPQKISHKLDLAEAYVAAGRLDDANTVAETALAASGGTPRCSQVFSVIALFHKDFPRALSRADEAIELDGAYAAAHKSRAAALGGLGRLNEAIQSAEKAASLSPQDAHIRALVDFLRTQQATRQSGGS
ncbi:MAG: tetratricopeptide repeat protein [Planctomycetes bacterium]|nr:tetratricopeptide repeat protein [Planctomycetota bacterium]